jgi:hypothetical protein
MKLDIDPNSGKTQQRRRFQSFLVIVEAKPSFPLAKPSRNYLRILHAFISLDSNATELMHLSMASLLLDTNSSL